MIKIEARKSSIDGLGVFTPEVINAGQLISAFRLEREVTAQSPLRPEEGDPEHCVMFDDRYCLVASPERYLNHACNPNTNLLYDETGIHIIALSDIETNSELTIDYLINNAGGDSWACNCGAARCRGKTGYSFFTLPKAFQREYRPLLAPWFVKRHQQEVEELDASLLLDQNCKGVTYAVSFTEPFKHFRRGNPG